MNALKLIMSLVVLVCKVPGLFFSFYYHRHAGVQAFERELLRSGLSAYEAAELTEIYKRMVFPGFKQLGRLLKTAGSSQNN